MFDDIYVGLVALAAFYIGYWRGCAVARPKTTPVSNWSS
jgi:hypothetical protein